MIYKKYNINIPADVQFILETIEAYECEAYIVGGCVRDSLLNKEPKDYDITTNLTPSQVYDTFYDLGCNVIETGIKHGTVTVMINKVGYEITTFRTDGIYEDNRHPSKVTFTNSLKDDLSRRDFTMNALAYNPKVGLVDYFNGMDDIESKMVKCVGNAKERFSEDALRILRGFRFCSQLGFSIEEETLIAGIKLKSKISKLSKERISSEINKMLLAETDVLKMMIVFHILDEVIPEIYECLEVRQDNPYHNLNVFNHIMKSVKNIDKKIHLKLAMLFHDITKPQHKTIDENGIGHFYRHPETSAELSTKILKRLKYDNDTIEKVHTLILHHDREISSKKSIRKLLNLIGEDLFNDLLKVKEADIVAQSEEFYEERHLKLLDIKVKLDEILNNNECFSKSSLNINGKDLIEIGYIQGRVIGTILDILMDKVLEDPTLNKKETLIILAKDMMEYL